MPNANVPTAASSEPYVVIAGTLDTKGEELRFIRDLIRAEGLRTRLVDLSTSGKSAGGDVSPQEIALASPRGSAGIASRKLPAPDGADEIVSERRW